jgi:Asp-tRNA(Asn)/Glu-tRNA(Gln) amidotransferase A subunit family amidase
MRHCHAIPVAVAPENDRATLRIPASICGFRGLTPTARRDPVFRSNGVLFQSNRGVSGPIRTVNSLRQIDVHSGTRRDATVIQGERPENRAPRPTDWLCTSHQRITGRPAF